MKLGYKRAACLYSYCQESVSIKIGHKIENKMMNKFIYSKDITKTVYYVLKFNLRIQTECDIEALVTSIKLYVNTLSSSQDFVLAIKLHAQCNARYVKFYCHSNTLELKHTVQSSIFFGRGCI
jgi:hypothetical protein